MDTHVTTGPVLDDSPTLRARLPGEPEDGLSAGTGVPPLHAEKREAPSPPARKHRRGLLPGVAIIAVVVIAGGGFLASPYNTVVPVPPAVKLAVLRAEARVAALLGHHTAPVERAPEAAPVRTAAVVPSHAVATPASVPDAAISGVIAPSAALAPIHAPAPPVAVVQPPYKPAAPNAEMAELLDLQPGVSAPAAATTPHESASPPVPAAPKVQPPPATPVQTVAAGPVHPPKSGTQPAAAPSSHQVTVAESAPPPPGYVAHEPGTVAVTAPGASGVPATPAPAAGPEAGNAVGNEHASAPSASPAAKAPPVAAKAPIAPAMAQVAAPTAHVQPLHVVEVGPGNVLAISPKLQAAPMATPQQIQVLDMVTQLATLIRDQRTQIANLQTDVQTSQKATSAKLSDFERRLALVEAGTALAAASGASASAPVAAPGTSAAPAATTVALTSAKAALAAASAPAAPAATVPAQPVSGTPEHYRVQAASPGLAMLAEVDRSGGDGAQQEVQVGDTLPGYGRVLSVSQQGTTWVVKTEHGTIQ